MSKKRSYMDVKNILSEGALKDFLLGLIKGKKGLKRDVKKIKKKIEKSVSDFNRRQGTLEKAIYKQYGKKVKLKRQNADDIISRAR